MESLPEEFLRGIELFNEGKFFECHEAWEQIWLKAKGVERPFWHAMIQVAAALHHVQRGNLKGARSVGSRAIAKLEAMPAQLMRLDIAKLRLSVAHCLANSDNAFPCIELLPENQ